VLGAALTLGAGCNQEMPPHGMNPDGAAGGADANSSSDSSPSVPDADKPHLDGALEDAAVQLDAGIDGGKMDAGRGDGGPAGDGGGPLGDSGFPTSDGGGLPPGS